VVQQGDNDSVSTAQQAGKNKSQRRSERRATNLGLVPQLMPAVTGRAQQQPLAGAHGRWWALAAFLEFLTLQRALSINCLHQPYA